ncbi:MAG: prepilin-type N-terminal cleavage/methylation domain-containing protein [Phycisphaerales bacterium]
MICSIEHRDKRVGARAFTLVEVLVTVVVLSIATVLVIPSMGSTGVLRVQSAVRQTVADITFAQSDAMAYQSRRAIWFERVPVDPYATPWTFTVGNGYTLAEINGPLLDLNTHAMFHPDDMAGPYARNFDLDRYGGARITSASFDGDALLIFDELGGPVKGLTTEDSSDGGFVEIVGGTNNQWAFRIHVAPMTGRVSVERVAADD